MPALHLGLGHLQTAPLSHLGVAGRARGHGGLCQVGPQPFHLRLGRVEFRAGLGLRCLELGDLVVDLASDAGQVRVTEDKAAREVVKPPLQALDLQVLEFELPLEGFFLQVKKIEPFIREFGFAPGQGQRQVRSRWQVRSGGGVLGVGLLLFPLQPVVGLGLLALRAGLTAVLAGFGQALDHLGSGFLGAKEGDVYLVTRDQRPGRVAGRGLPGGEGLPACR